MLHTIDTDFAGAHSAELMPEAPHKVICFMPEISKTHMGGTMRLGLRPTLFEPKTEQSKLRRLYGSKEVAWERHRHRYEVEPKYVEELESKGNMRFIGKDERGERMQMLELDGKLIYSASVLYKRVYADIIDHPYFVGLQAHPEFCSRPLNPSPPFLGLVAAACGASVLEEQIANNEKNYEEPHPESAKIVPASEGVTESAKGKQQAISGVKVREFADPKEEKEHEVGIVGERLQKMGLEDGKEA
jgi:CTP synthase